MSAIPLVPASPEQEWHLPYKGRVGMYCLIIAESAIFTIFVVAYMLLHRQEPLRTDAAAGARGADLQYHLPALKQRHYLAGRAQRLNVAILRTFGLWWVGHDSLSVRSFSSGPESSGTS